ncbi:hypothetical protein ACFLZ7_03345 [Nanoarchaeota archaeon]
MQEIILAASLGAIGGFVRGLVGISKAFSGNKKIKPLYLLATIIIAMIVGLFTVAVLNFNVSLALLAGYAGSDFLEGIVKTRNKKGFDFK